MKIVSTKLICTAVLFFAFNAANVSAQTAPDILATAKGFTFGFNDLPAQFLSNYNALPNLLKQIKKQSLDNLIANSLLEHEARLRSTTIPDLLEKEVILRAPKPTAMQIKAVYAANKSKLNGKSLEEIRPQIVEFLTSEAHEKSLQRFIAFLKIKHKFKLSPTPTTRNPAPETILASFSGGKMTNADLLRDVRPRIFEAESAFYENTRIALEEKIFYALIGAEANRLGIDASEFIAREITNKIRDFTDSERESLEDELRTKLFAQYSVKFNMKEPEVFAQNISVDDDPSEGDPSAPVTIVMFSDFQCGACAATHPILKRVMAEFPGKVRFVLRDFPLNRHRDAFLAAQAANAAHAQGKFFAYAEILYANQDRLDSKSLIAFAADLGLNTKQFELDLTNGRFNKEVNDDIADGKSYAITSTPAIFVNGVKVFNISARGFRKAISNAIMVK